MLIFTGIVLILLFFVDSFYLIFFCKDYKISNNQLTLLEVIALIGIVFIVLGLVI